MKTDVLLDEVRAGGRIPLIIGRGLTAKAREALGLPVIDAVPLAARPAAGTKGFTLGAKNGRQGLRSARRQGVRPGTYCEPKMTTVGSQDTTGPMTRDELKDLACLGFSADLVMQSFCHTAAYPKPVDVNMHHELPDFIMHRGGVSLAPGRRHHPLLAQPHAAARHRGHRRRFAHPFPDRHLLPGRLRPGGVCRGHRRDAAGHAGDRCWCALKARCSPASPCAIWCIAIPLYAIKAGLLTVEKKGKKNIFSGRILEIEGLPDLKIEQAFELSDASAERSAAGCTVQLDEEPIIEYLNSNITLLKWMIAEGYSRRAHPRTPHQGRWKPGWPTRSC